MKLRHLFIAICIILSSNIGWAQVPVWKWAASATGKVYDQASTVTADASGNVIAAGYYASDSIIFGAVTLMNSSPGFDEIFIVKYDSSGQLLWAIGAGGSSDDKASSVATDAAGNIYVTGYFYSPVITFGSFTLTNAGTVGDVFIVKYDAAGNVIWAKREGGPGLEIPHFIEADGAGNLTVGGRFSSLSITFGAFTLTQAGSMDVFVVRYDAGGNVQWAKGAGGGGNDEVYACGRDAAGNIYVSGYFNQNANFDGIILTTNGNSDIFLAKYDPAGNILWARKTGGDGDDRATGIAVDVDGNCYAGGFFQSTSIVFGNATLMNAGSSGTDNSFIAKFDSAGNAVWAHAIHGRSEVAGIVLTAGNLYSCGTFRGDTLSYGPMQLLLQGSSDFFIANCDTAGTAKRVLNQTSGGESSESAYAIASDAWGNILTAGFFNSDPIAFGNSVLASTGNGFEMFVARLGIIPTGMEDISSAAVILFPNPSSGIFEIIFDQKIRSGKIELFNVQGEKIFEENIFNEPIKIFELSNHSSGIYFLKTTSDEKVYVKKLILQ